MKQVAEYILILHSSQWSVDIDLVCSTYTHTQLDFALSCKLDIKMKFGIFRKKIWRIVIAIKGKYNIVRAASFSFLWLLGGLDQYLPELPVRSSSQHLTLLL